MQLKISKTLEGLIARSAFNTTKAGITHSLKDFLALELLREEGSLAFQLLSARLRDWEFYQIRLRIEREVASAKAKADDRSSGGVLPQLLRRTARHVGRSAERHDGSRPAVHRRRPHDGHRTRTGNVRHHAGDDRRGVAQIRRRRRLPHGDRGAPPRLQRGKTAPPNSAPPRIRSTSSA